MPLERIQEITADINHPSPLDTLERAESAAAIRLAVASLPEHQRETITPYYIGAHSQSEIADFLDITEGAVRKRLHDARKALKERLLDMVKETLHNDAPSRDDRFERHVLLSAAAERGDVEEVRRIVAEAPELAHRTRRATTSTRFCTMPSTAISSRWSNSFSKRGRTHSRGSIPIAKLHRRGRWHTIAT